MPLLYLATALILGALARFGLWWLRSSRTAATAVHYELIGTGAAPLSMDTAHAAGEMLTNTLLKDKASIAIHRWYTAGVSHTAVSVFGARNPDAIVSQIATKAGASFTKIDAVPLPEASAYALSRRGSRTGRHATGDDTVLAGWSNEVVSLFENGGQDAFVSVGMTPMTVAEVTRLRTWLRHHLAKGENESTHPQIAAGALMKVRFVAGSQQHAAADTLVSGPLVFLPGFDTAVSARSVTDKPLMTGTLSLAAAGALTAVAGSTILGVAMVVVGAALTAALVAVPHSILQRLLLRFLSAGVVPTPAATAMRRGQALPHAKKLAKSLLAKKVKSASDWSVAPTHPLHRGLISLAPVQTAALLVMPAPAASVAELGTTKAGAPAALNAPTGVRLGWDANGKPVHISDFDRQFGIFVTGDPGAGKTQELIYVWGGDLIARKHGLTDGAAPLRDGKMAMLWVETKGEGAQRALAAARRAGYAEDEVLYFDAGSSVGPRLELLDRGRAHASVRDFVAALTYTLEKGSILSASKAVLLKVLTLALLAPEHVIANAVAKGHLASDSPIELAVVLLGGRVGNASQKELFEALKRAAAVSVPAADIPVGPEADIPVDPEADNAFVTAFAEDDEDLLGVPAVGGTYLSRAVADWDFYMSMTPAVRAAKFDAPLNKMSDLCAAANLWNRDDTRPTFTLAQLLREHRVAILDFSGGEGQNSAADGHEGLTGDDLSAALATVSLVLLRNAIRATCRGWQAANQSVGFYCDELATIAGKGNDLDGDVIAWAFDKGRAFGLRLAVATQRWQQLPPLVSGAARTAGTLIYLRLKNQDVAAAAIGDVASADSAYTVEDLRHLANREAIAGTLVHGTPLRTPFTLHVPRDRELNVATYYDAERHAVPDKARDKELYG